MENESITAIVDNNDVQREVFKLSSVFIEKRSQTLGNKLRINLQFKISASKNKTVDNLHFRKSFKALFIHVIHA